MRTLKQHTYTHHHQQQLYFFHSCTWLDCQKHSPWQPIKTGAWIESQESGTWLDKSSCVVLAHPCIRACFATDAGCFMAVGSIAGQDLRTDQAASSIIGLAQMHDNLHCLPLNMSYFVYILLQMWFTELDTVLQMKTKHGIKWNYYFLWLRSYSSVNAARCLNALVFSVQENEKN